MDETRPLAIDDARPTQVSPGGIHEGRFHRIAGDVRRQIRVSFEQEVGDAGCLGLELLQHGSDHLTGREVTLVRPPTRGVPKPIN